MAGRKNAPLLCDNKTIMDNIRWNTPNIYRLLLGHVSDKGVDKNARDKKVSDKMVSVIYVLLE
jgi:hypothetical protein